MTVQCPACLGTSWSLSGPQGAHCTVKCRQCHRVEVVEALSEFAEAHSDLEYWQSITIGY